MIFIDNDFDFFLCLGKILFDYGSFLYYTKN